MPIESKPIVTVPLTILALAVAVGFVTIAAKLGFPLWDPSIGLSL